ncbi:hypothetical protein FAIPA1_180027 [Frankia sp. AiPs1]
MAGLTQVAARLGRSIRGMIDRRPGMHSAHPLPGPPTVVPIPG